jgi:biopolymer transport protein ExbB
MSKVMGMLAVAVGLLVMVPSSWCVAQTAPSGLPAGTEMAPAAPAAAHGGGSHAQMNLVTIVFKSGWFGVLIWMALLVALVVCIAFIVDAYLTVNDKVVAPQALVDSVRQAIGEGDIIKAMELCNANPCPLSNILKAGFSNVEEGFEVIQDSVTVAADIESERVLGRVNYLSLISNTTPMLGLIGTVQGMIFAFFTLGTQEAGAAQQAMLALNISHGLWATAVGLGTSVPATIYFYYFKNKATRSILGMEALTLDIIKSLRNVEVVEN